MGSLIFEMLKYFSISAGVVVFAWMIRDFKLNGKPLRRKHGSNPIMSQNFLETTEELEIPVERHVVPNYEKCLNLARQSPHKTAKLIHKWLKEDESKELQWK